MQSTSNRLPSVLVLVAVALLPANAHGVGDRTARRAGAACAAAGGLAGWTLVELTQSLWGLAGGLALAIALGGAASWRRDLAWIKLACAYAFGVALLSWPVMFFVVDAVLQRSHWE